MPARLWKTSDLAKELGLPHDAMVRSADSAGLLIQCGSAKRILDDEILELIEACCVRPKEPASISENAKEDPPYGSSAMKGRGKYQQARTVAAKLKRPSLSTSPIRTAQVVQLPSTNCQSPKS